MRQLEIPAKHIPVMAGVSAAVFVKIGEQSSNASEHSTFLLKEKIRGGA